MAKTAVPKASKTLQTPVLSQSHPQPKANTRMGRQAVTKSRPNTRLASKRKLATNTSTAAKHASRFLELPAEIRNMIYEALFIVNDTVPEVPKDTFNIMSSTTREAGLLAQTSGTTVQLDILIEGNARNVRWGLEFPYHTGGPAWTDYHAPHRKPSGFNAALFAVNKQIHDEAAQFFYGSNNFRFGTTTSLYSFLRSVGEHARLLRSIEVSGQWRHAYFAPSATKSGRILGRVGVNLQRFHIDTTSRMAWPPLPRPQLLATAFGPLFEMLYRREKENLQRLWEVVTIGNDGQDEVTDLQAMQAPSFQGPEPKKKVQDIFRPVVEAGLVKMKQEMKKGSERSLRQSVRATNRVNYAEVVEDEVEDQFEDDK